jgi:oligoendopeptidase F
MGRRLTLSTNQQYTTATNLQGPDLAGLLTSTQKYFNNFYSIDYSTGPANDAVVAFFEQYTKNKKAAKNLAAAVIYTAQTQGLNPLDLLSDFRQLPKNQLNTYLVAFLNANRAPTSFIGIKDKNKSNPFVNRLILL